MPTTSSRCPPEKFQCHGTLQCIPMELKCNGESDCVDGSDELTTVCNTSKPLQVKLLVGEFYGNEPNVAKLQVL